MRGACSGRNGSCDLFAVNFSVPDLVYVVPGLAVVCKMASTEADGCLLGLLFYFSFPVVTQKRGRWLFPRLFVGQNRPIDAMIIYRGRCLHLTPLLPAPYMPSPGPGFLAAAAPPSTSCASPCNLPRAPLRVSVASCIAQGSTQHAVITAALSLHKHIIHSSTWPPTTPNYEYCTFLCLNGNVMYALARATNKRAGQQAA